MLPGGCLQNGLDARHEIEDTGDFQPVVHLFAALFIDHYTGLLEDGEVF